MHKEQQPWYRRLRVGIEVGPTGANDQDNIYMAQMTGAAIFANLVQANAEYAVIFMKDHKFAYYNSAVARKCPTLGERDLLQECLVEAKRLKLPLIAYCQVQYDTATWQAHPEWRMKDAEGKEIGSRLCYNSGYVEQIKATLAELMAYDLDGFHIDMLDFGFGPPYGCWCAHCQAKFRERYGMAMPAGVTWDEGWAKMLQFRADANTRFCQDVQAFVRAQRPGWSVDFNYHGYPPFSWEAGQRPVQHALNGDFVTAEGLPWVFGHSNPGLLSLFMAGARPGAPFQGVASRSVYNYHDFTVRPTAEMEWEVFTYLAHGAMCTIVDKANYDGALDPLVYERIGLIFNKARQRAETFGHRPRQDVGLYYSSRSRDWYGRTDPPAYFAAFSGAHSALMQTHIPLGMIMDEQVTLAQLQTFPVVYLPNAAVLTTQEVELFERYVAAGGHLLITGLTGVCDQYGQIKATCDLSHLIGARLVRCITDHPDNYLRLPSTLQAGAGDFLLRDIPADWPFLTWGPVAVFEPTSAQAWGELLCAHRSTAQDNLWRQLMSPQAVVGPAVLVNQVGAGKVVCLPAAVDAAWIGNYRVPEHRHLLRNLVRFLHPHPLVEVTAPRQVEVVVTQDDAGQRLLIHFLAFNAAPTTAAVAFPQGRRVLPALMEEPLPYTAQVTVRRPFGAIDTTHAPARVTGPTGQIVLEIEEIHEVLSIQIAPSSNAAVLKEQTQ